MKIRNSKVWLGLPVFLMATVAWSTQIVTVGPQAQIVSVVADTNLQLMNDSKPPTEVQPTGKAQFKGSIHKLSWVKEGDKYVPKNEMICDAAGEVPFYDLREVPQDDGYYMGGDWKAFTCTTHIKDVGEVVLKAAGAVILWGPKQTGAGDRKSFVYMVGPDVNVGEVYPDRLRDWAQASTPESGLVELTSHLVKPMIMPRESERTEENIDASFTIVDSGASTRQP